MPPGASGTPATQPQAASDTGFTPEQIGAVDTLLREGLLGLVFQPIVDLHTGALFAYETLARPKSPHFSGPLELFGAAVQAGRVGELGRLHREQVLAVAPRMPLFLNVSPGEFDYPWLVRPDDPIFLHRAQVYIEVTESAPLSHFEQCRHVLNELRKNGILLAVDDLGAGYSNLKYISDLAPDVVKLDRELVAGVRNGTRGFRLLDSIVDLCKAMGAKVVVEGIETPEELAVAKHAGADYAQGYLFGMPTLNAEPLAWAPPPSS